MSPVPYVFDYRGSYEKFNDFMNAASYACKGGHSESRSPKYFVKIVSASSPTPIRNWVPATGRNYVDIFDDEAAEILRIKLGHISSGVYVDRRTRKSYDDEQDTKGNRHYYEVTA